ncbi:hypothetical protein GUITHDRAFT_145554 [Guillardia theta CCMP2712]|uniref:Uncharacterized protein n=2 Tax=Guillardia theta TaxID=55529 RepID=L1ILL8_GUITC|nr:hypothetical protein GUITHDRAFT_145554 [Guillardia theta CCMP2712]EKX36695.1 hypothetical protein GUITHDRAFT_145554 [Guillardia theta CCMP2712]|eukprot:XP_005823675.1 hypothetical protein GUITHDRAFT_145554 [Guillardia theta CCMP2712]
MGEHPVHLVFLLAYGHPNQRRIMDQAFNFDELTALLECCYEHDGPRGQPQDLGIYTGESILHICIANNDCKSIDGILKKAGDKLEILLGLKATGLFFQPLVMRKKAQITTFQRWMLGILGIDRSHEDYGCDAIVNIHSYSQSFAYFGEFPLSFAASQGNVEICNKIFARLSNDVQWRVLTQVDSSGNNALHIAVLHGHEDMIDFLLKKEHELKEAEKEKEKQEKLNSTNTGREVGVAEIGQNHDQQGYTPFTLAVRHGQVRTYQYIVDQHMKKTEWRFGAKRYTKVSCEQLDNYGVKNSSDDKEVSSLHQHDKWKSVFEIIVNFELAEFCDDHVFEELLTNKWKSCRHIFFFFVLLPYIIYLALFCYLLHLRTSAFRSNFFPLSGAPIGDVSSIPDAQTRIVSIILVFFSVCLLVYGLSSRRLDSLLLRGAKPKERKLLQCLSQLLQKNMLSLLCILTATTVLTSFGLQEVGNYKVELSFLSLAALFSFLTLLYVAIPYHPVGKLVMIMEDIMFQDVLICLIVYLIFMFGFTAAIYLMFQNSSSWQLRYSTDFDYTRNPLATAWALVWNSLGDAYMYFHVLALHSQDRNLAVTLEVIWVILSRILIMNLLIAMMNSRYKRDCEGKNRRWVFHRARMMLMYERWRVASPRLFPGHKDRKDKFLYRLEEIPRESRDVFKCVHDAAKSISSESRHAG